MIFRYYRPDGLCANPNDAFATAIEQPFIRLFESTFNDGIDLTNGASKLPLARELVVTIQKTRGPHIDQRSTHNDFSTFFGQIITHDMMKTCKSQLALDSGGGFMCCNPHNDPFLEDLINKNPYCLPIKIPDADPFFSKFNQKCMNYIRNCKTLKNCAVESDTNPVSILKGSSI